MATKYYAVKEGLKTGVFTDWNEVDKYVTRVKGAKFKVFKNKEDAIAFVEDDSEVKIHDVCCYVDGSYNSKTNEYGSGIVIVKDGVVIKTMNIKGDSNDPDIISLKNIAGELLAAMHAVNWCEDNNIKELTIFYDYEGIGSLINGEWKARAKGTKKYLEFMKRKMKSLNITFQKVKAHSGVEFNEYADMCAKKAVFA